MYTNVVILEGKDLQFERRSQQFQNGFKHLLKPDDAFGFLVTICQIMPSCTRLPLANYV